MAECLIYASVSKISINSDTGLSHVQRQVIIWTNADLLSIRSQATYFNNVLFEIQSFHLI